MHTAHNRPDALPVGVARFGDTHGGGRGERLRPLTLITPKPLLKIGSRPIIDYNVESLAAHGITDITVTTNYLAEMIHEHFSEPRYGVNVKCLRETAPLGTLGAVSLVERDDNGVTLVMNSDLPHHDFL